MAGLSELSPTMPTPAERLADDFVEVYQRLQDLEGSRAGVSFGHGAPTDTTGKLGSQYVDLDNDRFYVLGPGPAWFSAVVQRGTAFSAATVSTGNTTWTDLGGPSVSLVVPPSAFILAFIDLEVMNGTNGVTTSTGAVGLYEATDIPTPISAISSTALDNVFHRRVTAPNNFNGADWPHGDWFAFQSPGSGNRTYALRHESGVAGIAPSWRNRRLTVLAI